MKLMWTAAALLLAVSAKAEQNFELKGLHYACKDASTMNLWDISGGSELIRYQMVQKDYCWKTPGGLRVVKIGETKQFANVQFFSGNGGNFFVYKSDLRVFKERVREPEPIPKTVVSKKVRLRSIKNTYQGNVYLIRGKPTVEVEFDAGAGLLVSFSILKDKLVQGFAVQIADQKNPHVTLAGKCGDVFLGLSGQNYFSVGVRAVDRIKRFADFEVHGRWVNCNPSKGLSYEIQPSSLRVEGAQFDQLMRSHTPQEMKKTVDEE